MASEGYFDWDNTPPWDTWVECVLGPDGPVLLSRVPFAYRSLVDKAIEWNPEGCIYWASSA